MRPASSYRFLLVLLALLAGLSACNRRVPEEERVDWTVSLDHTKKTPYGSAVAYESVPDYFPGVKREPLTKYFRYTSFNSNGTDKSYADSVEMLVLLGLNFRLTEREWTRLLRFARNGNEIFLLTSKLDPRICRDLRMRVRRAGDESQRLTFWNPGNGSEQSLSLASDSTKRYGFTGRYINGCFETGIRDTSLANITAGDLGGDIAAGTEEEPEEEAVPDFSAAAEDVDYRLVRRSIDTQAQILGWSKRGPNFIRYRVGSGHITLHAAPLSLSNYFLLQPENRPYLDGVWQQFPANISRIYWNEFLDRKAEKSSLGGLLRHPAMRYALLIAALTLLLYVIFSAKRRQRIIPVIPPLENASVSFVETVGRLYFNKGNHLNLAEKMIQHFLEWVRATYYLDTSLLNQPFVEHLSRKSGKPEAEVQALVTLIHDVRTGSVPGSPEMLNNLYRRIQSFYEKR